jgi:hypothetical protein
MAVTYNSSNYGLFKNGDFEKGTNENFTGVGTIYSGNSYRGKYSLQVTGGGTLIGDQYVPVDPTKYYTMSVRAKTLTKSSPNNYLGIGYLGFATYDQFYNLIDLRNCGDNGNTTLTRACNPGDSYIYVASSSGWTTNMSELYYYRNVLFFPATHPYYNRPWKYTRIGFGDFNIYYNEIVDVSGNGTEWRLRLSSDGTTNMTMPNIGYSLPVGTPISRGIAGGTYSYVFGNPEYPMDWTTFTSAPFTGESYNSSTPFRYGTKYIRFMNLPNYGRTSETTTAKYLFDDITLIESPNNRVYNLP